MLRFDQATAPACSPRSGSSRLGAERWPSRSTVAFGSLVDDETHRDLGRTGNRQSETVFRDQTAGRPRAGHPALRGDRNGCLRPPWIWNGASIATAIPRLIARAARPPSGQRSLLLRAVPGRQPGDRPRWHPRVGSSETARLLAGLAPTGGLQVGPRYWRQPRLGCLLASGRSLLYASVRS